MTDEKKSAIESASEALTKARDKYIGLGMVNTYGKTPEERIRLDKDYDLAFAELREAETNLTKAQES